MLPYAPTPTPEPRNDSSASSLAADINIPLLPPPLEAYSRDISERLSAPYEYALASVLCVVGAAISCRCGIRPKLHDSWTVLPNFWALLVGEPSSAKSPVMSQPLRLLQNVERQLQETSSTQPPPRLITNDATGEKLVELLRDNPSGLLLARDEVVGLFESWHRSGRQGERQLFLEAWNGSNPFTMDRIGRGSIHAKNLCLSVMGTIQPALLARYLGGPGAEDGLAQRFQLLVYPENKPREFSDQPEDRVSRDAVQQLLTSVVTADYAALCGPDTHTIPSLTFAEDAYVAYKTWWNRSAREECDPLLKSYLTKHDRLIPALALVDHLVSQFADGRPTKLPPVGLASTERAIRLSDFFAANVARVLASVPSGGAASSRTILLDRLLSGWGAQGFTVREIVRSNWSGLTDRHVVQAAINILLAEGHIISVQQMGTGRPTVRYFLRRAGQTTPVHTTAVEPVRADETAETAETAGTAETDETDETDKSREV